MAYKKRKKEEPIQYEYDWYDCGGKMLQVIVYGKK